MQPLISVIIPVYNHADALVQSLRTLEKQTYRPFEVVIVDDGSSIPVDEEQVRACLTQSVIVIRQENQGAPIARNNGFAVSRGEYVIFWDADIIAEPTMLEDMYVALQHNPDVSYAYSDFVFGKKKMKARVFDGERLKKINYITTTSLLRRNDFFGFDPSLKKFQDWDLWLTLLNKKKIGTYVPKTLFRVLPHRGGISAWLPSFAYQAPFKWLPGISQEVKKYEEAKRIIKKKHSLL